MLFLKYNLKTYPKTITSFGSRQTVFHYDSGSLSSFGTCYPAEQDLAISKAKSVGCHWHKPFPDWIVCLFGLFEPDKPTIQSSYKCCEFVSCGATNPVNCIIFWALRATNNTAIYVKYRLTLSRPSSNNRIIKVTINLLGSLSGNTCNAACFCFRTGDARPIYSSAADW